mmetsp:Transcript_9730/g.17131  ORF Transcript_9730/g.17131 Transcript_9730/m.17131 type:complete len:468 (-) Transcript_9730:193-1596(-)
MFAVRGFTAIVAGLVIHHHVLEVQGELTVTQVAGVPVYMNSQIGVQSAAQSVVPSDWVVQLPASWSDKQVQEFASNLTGRASVRFEGHPSENGLSIVVIHATFQELETLLADHAGAEYVEQDYEVSATPEVALIEGLTEALNSTTTRVSEGIQINPPSWGLERIDQRDLPLGNSYMYEEQAGSGVHVYVLDTGIRTTHKDFDGRAVPTLESLEKGPVRCKTTDTGCAADHAGHGTHCAGTIAGSSYGVAKKATLHAVKVLSDSGTGSFSWLLAAIDWVMKEGQQPAVISASLGCSSQCSTRGVVQAIQAAHKSGVTVVVAAGNSNDDACKYGPPAAPSALVVGSTTSQDARSSFSNHGSCLDIFAPGSDIVSASHLSDTGSATMSGTSMACPHVSGAAALVLGRNARKSPDQVAESLIGCASRSKVRDPIARSPNLLLYSLPCTPQVISEANITLKLRGSFQAQQFI